MLRTLLAFVLLLSSAFADVIIVDALGAGDYPGIQLALANATDDDLILVRSGSYNGFLVSNRTIRIVASPPGSAVHINDTIRVRDIAADQSVVLSGLDVSIQGPLMVTADDIGKGLIVRNCDGPVRVQDCEFEASPNSTYAGNSFDGISVENSDDFALVSSEGRGGPFDAGLDASDSQIALAQCLLVGGRGLGCTVPGSGVILRNSSMVFDSDGQIYGGRGADDVCPSSPCYFLLGADGGPGTVISSGGGASVLTLLGSDLQGGGGGFGLCNSYFDNFVADPGPPFALPPALPPTFLAGTARTSDYPATVAEGGTLFVELTGEAGDEVTLILSKTAQFDATGPGVGVRLVGPSVADPDLYREIPLGTLPGPSLTTVASFPFEAMGFEHATWFAQTMFEDTNQVTWYGPGRTITVLPELVHLSYTDLCSGDGGDQAGCTDCPCLNNSAPQTVGGCLNSAGTSTRLITTGDPSVSLPFGSSSDLSFGLVGAPPSAFCLLTSGAAVAPQGIANPCFGLNSGIRSVLFDGLRCAVQSTRRHAVRAAAMDGTVGYTTSAWGGTSNPQAGLAQAAGFNSGQTRYFQVIHRDDPLAVCMRGLNTSQAVEVTFTP